MTEEIEFILDSTKESMTVLFAFRERILNIRAGKKRVSCHVGSVFCRLLRFAFIFITGFPKIVFQMLEQLPYSRLKKHDPTD
jgi:hypothetical protein